GPVVVESGSARPSAGDATVRVTRRDPGAIDLDVTAAAATTLVVSQSYAPQWAAHVDGASAPVWPADVLFQAVPVPAGHHVVTLRYSPSTVTAGLAVSALALLVVLAAALLPLVRRR